MEREHGHKYYAGETVMVRPDICVGERFGIYVNQDMASYAGKIVVIKKQTGTHGVIPSYSVIDDGYGWVWTEDLFMPYELEDVKYELENLSVLYG